jgi:tetratricopeptide (TPR) repeat protein
MKTSEPKPDYYQILGVNRDATLLEIKAAWQKRLREYDPEKLQGFGEKLQMLAKTETVQIHLAYDTLKDPDKRKKYDRKLVDPPAKPKTPTQTSEQEKTMSTQVEIANDRAIEYWNQNRFTDAIAQWKEAARNYPDVAEIHHNLGNAYAHQGQLDKAIESLKQAISVDEALVEAHNKLGCIYYKQGNLDLAFASWNQALKIDPNFQEALRNLQLIPNVTQFDREDSEIPPYQHVTEEEPKPGESQASKGNESKSTWGERFRQRFGKSRKP